MKNKERTQLEAIFYAMFAVGITGTIILIIGALWF